MRAPLHGISPQRRVSAEIHIESGGVPCPVEEKDPNMTTILQKLVLAAGLLVAPTTMAQQPGSQTGGDTLKTTTPPSKSGDASAPSPGGAALRQTTKPDGEKQVQGDNTTGASSGPASSKQPAAK
jgi:hypothetical protein